MNSRYNSSGKQRKTVRTIGWRYGGGILLLLVSLAGVWQAGRASRAYALMYEALFGETRRDADKVLLLHHRAHLLYPHSYHLAIHAGSLAWYHYIRAHDADDSEQAAHYLDQVRRWTRIGLYRNPYPLQLRWLNQRLLEIDDSIEAAIDYWEQHTEWHYWYAYNHAVLADLYIRAGRLDDAERTLPMLRGSPYYDETVEALQDARRLDMKTED